MPGNSPTLLWPTWPVPPFTVQAFASFDDKMFDSWRKLMGLNTDFAQSMMEETQFDWASCFMPQDPEEFYVRQWSSQIPLLSIPLRYATAMVELGAATQRYWMDAWGHVLGIPMLLPPMPATADVAAAAAHDGDVEDVPAAAIRETPHPRKSKPH